MPATTVTPASTPDGFRRAYLLLSFGLLASVAYRAFVRQEPAWDLLALVLLGGLATAWSRARRPLPSLVAMVVALVLGAALAVVAR